MLAHDGGEGVYFPHTSKLIIGVFYAPVKRFGYQLDWCWKIIVLFKDGITMGYVLINGTHYISGTGEIRKVENIEDAKVYLTTQKLKTCMGKVI